ncbi:hypothetical protein QMO40_10620 [Mannheimia bovis]|uniref:hypothetical protein n=1 Tax=Mannheimia TaxID=75984 RepID=UPI0024B76EB4|nr:hypothetical protein [Mannheimia bovis]WHP47056.1 hypothetical protein QMO40_10620 [Mannheimia bovis]
MKKYLLPLLVIGMSNTAYAGCYNGEQTAYFVKNGKISKQIVNYDTCGNMNGGFESWGFQNDKQLSIGSEGENAYTVLDGKDVEQVTKPNGVPSSFVCYASSSNQKEVYCVESGQ